MKYISCYIAICCVAAFTACKDDFDELEDTSQRHIEFFLDTSNLFEQVLTQAGGSFQTSLQKQLPNGCQLRIASYCYDSNDSLVSATTQLTDKPGMHKVKVRHLEKDQSYRFFFLADVVKYDTSVDYFETWFQMNTKNRKEFYLYADNRNDDAHQNVVLSAESEQTPANQQVTVSLQSITYNGYCRFTNLSGIDRLNGYVAYVNSINLSTQRWMRRSSMAYEFVYHNPAATTDIVKPVTLSCADSIVTVSLRKLSLSEADSVIFDIPNTQRRPFVTTIDCQTLELIDCKFY